MSEMRHSVSQPASQPASVAFWRLVSVTIGLLSVQKSLEWGAFLEFLFRYPLHYHSKIVSAKGV